MARTVVRNIAQCRKCGDVIESKHVHDFVSCKCGNIFIDGGHEYQRYGAKDLDDVILLTEVPELNPEGGFISPPIKPKAAPEEPGGRLFMED